MKKTFLILFVLLTLSGEAIHGQSQPSASLLQGIGSQIEKKMQRFLTIIEIVGTYSSVPQQEKLTMITEDAPALFWDYGHRSMVVTSRNCPGGRSKPVAEYLRQLRIQSRFVSAAPLYNCRLLSPTCLPLHTPAYRAHNSPGRHPHSPPQPPSRLAAGCPT